MFSLLIYTLKFLCSRTRTKSWPRRSKYELFWGKIYSVFTRQSKVFGDFTFLKKFFLRQGQADRSNALAARSNLYILVLRTRILFACSFTIFVLLCLPLLEFLGWKKPNSFALSCRRAKFPLETEIGLILERKGILFLCHSGWPN